MKKVIDTENVDWEMREALQTVLGSDELPRLIIIEGIEER